MVRRNFSNEFCPNCPIFLNESFAQRYALAHSRMEPVSRDDHIQKALRSLTTAEGEQLRLSPKSGILVPATCGSSGPGGFSQHDARLLTGGAVDVVVAEEYLRGGSAGSTVLGHVVGTDVDGGCGGFLNELDAGGLAGGAGDTVGLTFCGFDDQEDAAVVGEGLVEFEGEGVTLAHDGGGGGILYTQEGRRYENCCERVSLFQDRILSFGRVFHMVVSLEEGIRFCMLIEMMALFPRKASGATLHGNQIIFYYRAQFSTLDDIFEAEGLDNEKIKANLSRWTVVTSRISER